MTNLIIRTTGDNFSSFQDIENRVWKGIFGIRDLTKIRCGNRENDKYIDGIRDLTVPREAGLAKNWARDAGFMFACLSGMPETFKNTRKFKISIERINLHLSFILLAFVEIRLFNAFFWERKAVFGKLMKNVGDAGFSRKTGGNAGSGPPLPPSRPWLMRPTLFMTMPRSVSPSAYGNILKLNVETALELLSWNHMARNSPNPRRKQTS